VEFREVERQGTFNRENMRKNLLRMGVAPSVVHEAAQLSFGPPTVVTSVHLHAK
jgi:hypothetical protein